MNKPLRIILAMIEPPLPFGNAAARWYYVLFRELVERGHQVRAFATCSNADDIGKTAEIFPAPQYQLRCYLHSERRGLFAKLETLRRPYSYSMSAEFQRDVKAAREDGFDILHLEQLWAGWAGLDCLEQTLVNVHHLVGIDLEFVKCATLRQRFSQAYMIHAENRLLSKLKYIRSCSPRITPEIRRQAPNAEIDVVPVGIDASQYPYISDQQRALSDQQAEGPIISVIGSHNWYPTSSSSQRFLDRLWPAIKKQVPNARAQLVGWNARSVLREYLDWPDVTIEENVPDTRPYFERTSAMLYAPARGSGMKIKILECLGYGVPVVTTSEGVEGLPATDGVHACIADDDAGLIERAIRLLQDREAQNRQRAAGRALLESHCGPKPTVDAIEAIYVKMLARNSA